MSKLIAIVDAYDNPEAIDSSMTRTYYVKAPTARDAFLLLLDAGKSVHGRRINSPYDCSGEWGCYPVYMDEVKWSKSRKCYMLSHRWYCDL